ncbi:2-amino-4-hydroxy-6-hydroxymethyldihydropteridine diphosphokinase [Arsenicitalea aurantiaca]|uniref:2-amino-4-hydroxy-6-hydroxymethyldihydropteridine pyrophosphokinase n=1 Tax=Arsenicitalea aurantiaca TaxID=1783274 RepID=A0A433XFT9_9HYPH|nr:2-amino-4-hydroxy-6-hydroxymethyldihydropteridine diphosphokinase [Arsenicitalea aurantiaca]RUT32969.1 2-amino-4-hydroxy-6-hydroxymethyldihydropteridine diphosphokinase [Arsenicitalea aurantiaca]
MARAWLGLGANLGEPTAQLEQAVLLLAGSPGLQIVKRSSIIESAPWGVTDQNPFRNMVLEVETESTPEGLLALCLGIEQEMGRVRTMHWGPRLIDIDVIAYERIELKSPTLTLPHPYAHERDFVLGPLREIAPDMADWIVGRATA